MWKTQILMLYSEESEVWIPESKEFCLICFKVGGGDLSSTTPQEQGKDSGPFDCGPPWWLEPEEKVIFVWRVMRFTLKEKKKSRSNWKNSEYRKIKVFYVPTKTRCHKLLDDCGKWNPRVSVADEPASNFKADFFVRLSAECDRGLQFFRFSTTLFSWILSNVLKTKIMISNLEKRQVVVRIFTVGTR